MIKDFVTSFKNIDLKIMMVMNNGFKVSFVILLIACYVLALYSTYPISHIAYFCGLNLFKLGLTCISAFFVCGIAINNIKQ